MKNVFIVLWMLFGHVQLGVAHSGLCLTADDMIDNIANCFQTGNGKELASYLSSSVSLAILDDNNTYSKSQAEILLRNFFSKYTFSAVKILHRIETNASNRYAVLELISSGQRFRVSLSLKKVDAQFLITDIRIDRIK